MDERLKNFLGEENAETLPADLDEETEETSEFQEEKMPELNSNATVLEEDTLQEPECPECCVSDPNAEALIVRPEGRVVEDNGVIEVPMFTQSQVNEMMGKVRQETRDRTFKYLYDRYGVNDEASMDDLVGTAQRFDLLKDEHEAFKKQANEMAMAKDNELNDIKERLALLESGIDKERYDDAKFILRGKGLEVNIDNILKEIETHPEWKHKEQTFESPELAETFQKAPVDAMPEESLPTEPSSKLSIPTLGNEPSTPASPELSEKEQARKLFGLR